MAAAGRAGNHLRRQNRHRRRSHLQVANRTAAVAGVGKSGRLTQILGPLSVDAIVGMGDEREQTLQSLSAARQLIATADAAAR